MGLAWPGFSSNDSYGSCSGKKECRHISDVIPSLLSSKYRSEKLATFCSNPEGWCEATFHVEITCFIRHSKWTFDHRPVYTVNSLVIHPSICEFHAEREQVYGYKFSAPLREPFPSGICQTFVSFSTMLGVCSYEQVREIAVAGLESSRCKLKRVVLVSSSMLEQLWWNPCFCVSCGTVGTWDSVCSLSSKSCILREV